MASNKKINVKERYTDGEIDLSMSDLSDVPVKDILALKKATSLDISNNRLTVLPKNFVTLTTLTKLDLSKNELKQLPDDFGNLTKLRYLDLYRNQLTHLPLSFHKLKDLKFLDLKDNPLVPTVAKVAGHCIDTKQCQACAKDIVIFFTKLQEQVDTEVEIRTKDRQRQLELNEKKKQEEKKNKKKEKQKKDKEVQKVQKVASKVQIIDPKNSQKEPSSKKTKQKKSKKSCMSSICTKLFVSLLWAVIVLFCLTSVNYKYTESVQKFVVKLYSENVQKISNPVWKNRVMEGGIFVSNFHEKTGQFILKTIEYLISIEAVRNAGEYVLRLIDYSKNKTIEIYKNIVK